MSLTSLLLFISAYAITVATPGPGVAALVARTLGRGTQDALPFVLGFVAGDLLWFIGAAAGLAALAKAYAPLFVALKYMGCAYLVFLACKLWQQEPMSPEQALPPAQETALTAFSGSLLLTLGNPKVMIFFLSIMPLVVEPGQITLMVGLELALIIGIISASILLGYMLLASRARHLFRSRRAIGITSKLNAGIMLGAAALIASR